MKKILMVFTMLGLFLTQNVKAQTPGDDHNAVLDRLINAQSTAPPDKPIDAIGIIKSYCDERKLPLNVDLRQFSTQNLQKATSWKDVLNNLQANKLVSSNLASAILKVCGQLEGTQIDESAIRKSLSNIRGSNLYSVLTVTDKKAYDDIFSDVLIKSYSFWSAKEGKVAARKSRCSCGFSCTLCVIAVDAVCAVGGSVFGPGGVIGVGAFGSIVARCCGICAPCCTDSNTNCFK